MRRGSARATRGAATNEMLVVECRAGFRQAGACASSAKRCTLAISFDLSRARAKATKDQNILSEASVGACSSAIGHSTLPAQPSSAGLESRPSHGRSVDASTTRTAGRARGTYTAAAPPRNRNSKCRQDLARRCSAIWTRSALALLAIAQLLELLSTRITVVLVQRHLSSPERVRSVT
jgi:hypothetical protein